MREGFSKGGNHHSGKASGDEAADGGDAERSAGAAGKRQAVAVQTRHHCRSFAWDVDQNGGGRAAVLRTVIDACEHDERCGRVKRIRDGKEHRHGGHGAHAWQYSDKRTQSHADEAVKQVRPSDSVLKADKEVVQKIHGLSASSQKNVGHIGTISPSPPTKSNAESVVRITAEITASRRRKSGCAQEAAITIKLMESTKPSVRSVAA